MWTRRLLLTAGVAAAAGVVTIFATPSVDDAPTRVAQLAGQHHAGQLLTRLPTRLKNAVLAVEDHRFYLHRGIDPLSLGATIEVQLAKWLYTNGRSGLRDQATQAMLALKLDVAYPKSQILHLYLNTVYFGHGYYGATAAAHGYFHCAPDALTWPQAALLAGLLKAPDGLDPYKHPAAARARRDYVLTRLQETGALTAAAERTAAQTDLALQAN